ncbi:MAG: biopolymer transporter ExbD [Deltaproteobacteria bacterium]|nr:biopolymer transporter ExbD [Deltaproteobacteria bacterium]MBW2120486.1 biopolymer transporter ExbD [Deltaproteobacteria bacterium]
MRIKRNVRKRARIEMIPLIDSMFLLLVFFIYSMLSMTVHRGIQVNLPEARTGKIDKRDYVAITITEDERVFLGKREVSLPDLQTRLERIKRAHPGRPVFINADRRVPYEVIIAALDAVRSAGLSRVSLDTQEKRDGT